MATVSAQEFLKGGKPSLVLPASTNFGVPQPQGHGQPGFFGNLKNDFTKRINTVKNFANTKGPTAPNAFEKFGVGVGQAVGAVGDVIGEGIKSTYNTLPQGVQNVVGPAVKKSFASALVDTVVPGAKLIPEPLKDLIGEKLKPQALQALQGGLEKYENFKKKNPVAATEFESALNILSAVPIGKGAKVAGEEVGALAKATGEAVGSGAKKVAQVSTDLAKEGVARAADAVSPIESGVKTVLKAGEADKSISKGTIMQKLTKYTDQAEKAITDYSQPTPMELAGQEGEKALKSLQGQMKDVGIQKKTLTKSIADTPVGDIVDQSRQTIRKELRESAGITFTKDGELRNAVGRIGTVSDPADLKLLKEVDNLLAKVSQKPTFQRVDDTIDHMQDLLFKRSSNLAVPVNGNVERVIKKAIKELNDNLKEIGGKEYKSLNTKYANRKKAFDALNKALGAEGNKGAALMKQLFSPNGTAPRKLFKAVKDLTGIDLVQESTLAKFAMENIGDVRQASLLEQVLKQGVPSKSGLVGMAAEKILGKLQNPIGKAKRIVESRKN